MPERFAWVHYIFLGLCLVLGCSEKESVLLEDLSESIYNTNNSLATGRVKSISYAHSENGTQEERFKLVHISDSHLSDGSEDNHYLNPVNLKQSIRFANQRNLKFNAIAATGDFISFAPKDKAIHYMSAFNAYFQTNNAIPSFLCTGNHDSNIESETIMSAFIHPKEINSLLFNSFSSLRDTEPQENYYYSDVPNPQGGFMRFIALDMLDQEGTDYNTMTYASYSQKQIDWLCNEALVKDMTPNHNIIILTHYPFQPYSRGGTGTYLCDGNYVHPWSMVPEIVEAFRSRSTLHKLYPNILKAEKTIAVDLDFSDAVGEFVCHLGGHAHCFATFAIDNLPNRDQSLVAQQMILCTNQAPTETGKIYNKVKRSDKSLSSNSFNIYAIDTKEKNIYITFFGAYQPEDDKSFPEVLTLSYL